MSKDTGVKVDHLKRDPIIAGQTYCTLSIVNPADMVAKKNLYYSNKFMVSDINKTIAAQAMQMAKKLSVDMRKKIDGVLDKLKSSVDEEDKHLYRILDEKYRKMAIDEDEYVDECHRKYTLDSEEILDRYKIYLSENRINLDREFDDAHNDATSVRGIKVRGVFNRYEEAAKQGKFLRDTVEPGIHAFVAEVGAWLPIDMEADEVQDQDYMLPALNDLMGKYHEGMRARKNHHEERQREMADATPANRKEQQRARLQKKLRENRSKKIKQEVAEFERLQGNDTEQ